MERVEVALSKVHVSMMKREAVFFCSSVASAERRVARAAEIKDRRVWWMVASSVLAWNPDSS